MDTRVARTTTGVSHWLNTWTERFTLGRIVPSAAGRRGIAGMELIRSFGRAGALAALALVVALVAGGYALANSSSSGPSSTGPSSAGTVVVSGSGTATVLPDTLTITMSVRALKPSAKG